MHKAIVCILAPYAHRYHHSSNPHLKQKFDEHTPRYLTNSFFQPSIGPLSPEVLNYTEVDPPPFDFRLLRMELFYLPPYQSALYEQEELEILQQLQFNVIDEIMYHFLVVKEHVDAAELERLSKLVLEEPICIQELRARNYEDEADQDKRSE